ncbi:hypothetical protein [Paenibacillus aestuarii]|uniref:Uncharacterized protein n=1 Tax=Paenibacillus aestuarii TaxID=516965 RepID=A0ABW0KDU3_9BACL|nr:hypothetical protein [Paenibacillus aestuarii]
MGEFGEGKESIEQQFYNLYRREITVQEFEIWLYSTPRIEEIYGQDFYFKLLDLNYKSKYIFNEIETVMYSKIPKGKFEQMKLEELLQKVIHNTYDLVEVLEEIYLNYCDGYSFLRYLGLTYVLSILDIVPALREKINWNEEDFSKKRKPLEIIRPSVYIEAQRLLSFLEQGLIKITDKYEYMDLRNEGDKIELTNVEKMFKKPKHNFINRALKWISKALIKND